MKRTLHLESFLIKNFYFLSLLAAFFFCIPVAKADSDKTTVTIITVEDINAEIEMPKVMRSGRSIAEGIHTLPVEGFAINAANNALNVAFQSEGKGNMYVRIVNQEGFDVYFETVKNNAQSYSKQIDTSTMKPGVYFFQVTRNGKTFTKKLILS
ncbi:MAG: T9SS type A sorting domain-containing protein [Bacteroidia bacterium]